MAYTKAQAQAFAMYIAPMMQAEAQKRGYWVVSTAIAQAIIEGAAGTSVLARDYHNHFGMKCGSSWKGASVNLKTKEEYTVGTLTTISDNFRAYANDEEGIKGYYDFIGSKRYANLKTAKNYVEYASRLKQDGYATSSTYVQTLCNTVQNYNLTKYDTFILSREDEYVLGRTYTLQANMYIRLAPNGDHMEMKSITTNAQLNAYTDDDGYSILRKDTRVTCKAIQKIGDQIWMQIPSGWIAARIGTKVYVK